MGQAFDRDGNVLGEATGATKREVFEALNREFQNAHEIRIRALDPRRERDPMPENRDELKQMVAWMRANAQGGFREGVEGIISEVRRFADAAEKAIGEISIDEALEGVARTVTERVAQLTGKDAALAAEVTRTQPPRGETP